ncbi:MAG: hypothetical protein E5V25_09565 [Mesorhizobium sp.]|nr:MAG: hypothetical protein E5V25_09565 [Mesorhizobium sp.]
MFGDANAYQPHFPAVASGAYAKVFLYDAVPGKAHEETQAAYEARVQPDHERVAKSRELVLRQVVGTWCQLGQSINRLRYHFPLGY